ncbi:MAG: SPFH domain-containing protein [Bacilli bacterium]|nr:SPFH domain-containing protein [Bacilli bacterium]
MGLIKAAVGAIGSTFGDQWQDLISCENMDENTLMVKKTTESGQISKGSRIIVAPGQVAVIYDSGNVVDATAEEGTYNFDQSTSPSFFGGQFGAVFKEMWTRFKYNGTPNKEQAVFYFNVKEILNNKFGTGTPIPFQDWSHAIPNQMTGSLMPLSVKVRCYGKYTFQIFDPAVFMRMYAGTANIVTKDTLTDQMTSEVIASFQNILNELGTSEHRIPVLELPSNTDEIKKVMDEKVFDEPIRNRGVKLIGFAVESVTLDEESNRKIEEYEHNSNAMMQQGRVLNVMEAAANNANGAANGFMGLGVMNMATGGMTGGVMANAFGGQQAPQQQYDPYQPAPAEQPAANVCSKCGATVNGKFCSECGTPVGPKTCAKCGAEVTGKFCSECGTPVDGKKGK